MNIDHAPATAQLTELVRGVSDDQLDDPTPCTRYSVGDLLDHIGGLALAFTEAAEKSGDPEAGPPAEGDRANLAPNWRTGIPDQLGTLAEAWQEPGAWDGMTRAGGIDMPGEIAGMVALEEVLVHGWDLARATGQPFTAADEHLGIVVDFFAGATEESRGDAFGPPAPVADGAPLVDRAMAASGRDPAWSP